MTEELIPYSGKLSREKTFVNGGKQEIRGKVFRGSLGATNYKWVRPSIFMEKTFADSLKITKFVKVFSLESFPLYGS